MLKIAVIGSGPSALASVWALSEFNVSITVFDTYVTEADQNSHSPNLFLEKLKLLKGSDFPYRHFASGPQCETSGLTIPYSFAYGGLSTVWGATMLPYTHEDISGWPTYMQDLHQEYNFISGRMPIARLKTKESRFYKDYSNSEGLLISKKIQALLEASKESTDNFEYGTTSLSVQTQTNDRNGCIYCNNCLEGCPYDFIWSTTKDWNFLRNNGEIEFKTGIRVLRVNDLSFGVNFIGVNKDGSHFQSDFFDHLILATGCIESFRISAASELCPSSAILKDSSTFLIPFFDKKLVKENTNFGFSLSQAYLMARTKSGCLTHLQFYTFSQTLLEKAKLDSWLARLIPNRLLKFVLNKLIFGIGYLPDSISPSLSMQLCKDGNIILKKAEVNSKWRRILNLRNFRFLPHNSIFRKAGIWPIKPLISILNPGLGAHYGGWAPAGHTTDIYGRFKSNSRVHLVDSSVLPSIPAGPITFTVMANAVRIINQIFK